MAEIQETKTLSTDEGGNATEAETGKEGDATTEEEQTPAEEETKDGGE